MNDTVTDIVGGERMVGAGPDNYSFERKAGGNPIDIVYPDDGAVLITSPVAVLKAAPHPNAGRLFMNFMYSREYSASAREKLQLSAANRRTVRERREARQNTLDAQQSRTPRNRHTGSRREVARNVQRLERRIDAGAIVFALAVAAVAIMVLLPLAWLLYSSFQNPTNGTLGFANYVSAFTKSIYLTPIANSLILATSVAAIAAAIGTPLAWLVARTDLPGRGLLRGLVIAAFVTPPFLGAQAWMLLAAPHSGWLNRAFVASTGSTQGPSISIHLPVQSL